MQHKTGVGQLNNDQIEQHLRSAVDTLTPDVLSRMDFSVPQETVTSKERDAHAAVLRLQRRMRGYVLAAAACFCVLVMGGGAYGYHVQNRIVESVIGIDVNPSIEISINKKQRVLSVQALNEDGQEILAGMDLEGTDLNVAVNAVVGSMVTHGYLDDLDNAILVTVSNDSVRKAKELRATVVSDIEQTLEENQVQAVVYDQQVIEDEEIAELAKEYGISYGKAYFLKELIEQNPGLTMDDMGELSSMTIEKIAARIAEDSYVLGELADQVTEPEILQTEPETVPEETEPETTAEEEPETTETETVTEETTTAAPETEEETEEIRADRVKIDYVDYEDGTVYVCFVTRVSWKNPTVSVRDDEGNAYSAMVDETSSDECTIEVSGLEGGRSYTFVLGGLTPREGGGATTVKGYFDVPEIAEEATDSYDDEEDDQEDDREDDQKDGQDNGQDSQEHGQTFHQGDNTLSTEQPPVSETGVNEPEFSDGDRAEDKTESDDTGTGLGEIHDRKSDGDKASGGKESSDRKQNDDLHQNADEKRIEDAGQTSSEN